MQVRISLFIFVQSDLYFPRTWSMFLEFYNRTDNGSGQGVGLLYLVMQNCNILYVPFTKLIYADVWEETSNAASILLLLSLS
jgi:hypothetical protein